MRRGDRNAIILSIAFVALTFLTLGLFIGARFIKDAALYFVFLNIITALYGLLGIGAVVALYKYFDFVGIALTVAYVVLSFGQLHFLPLRLYHKLHCILFWICIAYLIYYLVRFLISKKNNVEFDNKRLVSCVLPTFYVGFSLMLEMFHLFKLIESSVDLPMGVVALGVILSVASAVIGAVLIKDRSEKKEFFGKLAALFFATIFLTIAVPLLTIEHTNYAFDSSEGEAVDCVVIDKYTSHSTKGGRSHRIVVLVEGEEKTLSVDRVVYFDYEIGDFMRLYKHGGAFDFTYYEYRLDSVYLYE